jgi:hypothetical protein
MRRTLGNAVFSGMLGVTLFGIFLTPVFFFAIDWLGGTHWLSHPTVHRLGHRALLGMTLGIPALLDYLRRQPWRARPPVRPVVTHGVPAVPVAGDGKLAGDGQSDGVTTRVGQTDGRAVQVTTAQSVHPGVPEK